MTTNYYCPRNCGTILSTKTQRHTCTPQPEDPEPMEPTIDVSTPETRQDILDELEELQSRTKAWNKESMLLWLDDKWMVEHGPDAIEAAFARIDELESLASDLAGFIDATHCSHPCCQDDPFVKGALALLDRARSAGVLP